MSIRNGIKLNGASGVLGEVVISPKALATVLEISAGSVEDVEEDVGKKFKLVFGSVFSDFRFVNRATLKLISGELVADIYIKVNPNVNIVQTSYQVQKQIIDQFKEMMDIKISRVNVHVVELIPKV